MTNESNTYTIERDLEPIMRGDVPLPNPEPIKGDLARDDPSLQFHAVGPMRSPARNNVQEMECQLFSRSWPRWPVIWVWHRGLDDVGPREARYWRNRTEVRDLQPHQNRWPRRGTFAGVASRQVFKVWA